jgi:hypothetical protein
MKRFFKTIIMIFIMMQVITLTTFAQEKFRNLDVLEESIYKHLENRDQNFTFIYTGERKEFQDNILKCMKEAYSKDDYLERSWLKIQPKAKVTVEGIETTMEVTYLSTKEEEEYVDAELEKITKSLINANMTELEKVKIINDYIENRYEYDYTLKSISVYSGLTTSRAICQTYSMTAYKMLQYAGIENRIVVGKIKEVPHSWNVVKIKDKWYQLDITNNDAIEKDKYFLVGDDILIANEYVWDRDKYPKTQNWNC